MMMRALIYWFMVAISLGFGLPVQAQTAGKSMLSKEQPIDIAADKLDVFQAEHKAIFSGNVIAVQGTTNMRATTMTVFYREGGGAETSSPAQGKQGAQGISRIEATGSVVFTTAEETAQGDKAIYDVDSETIDLTGARVVLTREQNVLQGTHLVHNMATGRSMLTSGTAAVSAGGARPARVHGLFIPKSGEKKTGKP